MSLINDALRRARQAHKKSPAPPGSDAPLQPVEPAPPGRRSSIVVVTGSTAIFILGLWFLWQWWNTGRPAPAASAKAPTTNQAPVAAKSSLASNLTRPFQAVDKLDAALKEARRTDASPALAKPPITSTSAVVRAIEKVASSAPPSPTNGPPLMEKATNGAILPAPNPTNALAALPASRNVAFPSLKLQGIYYRLSKPSVLINNRTLFLGDEVDGVRVVGIERYTVKVELKGATKELFLK